MKNCSRCGTAKPLEDFGKDNYASDKHTSQCKMCRRELSAQWRAKNPEKSRTSIRKWESQNKILRSAYRKKYRRQLRENVLRHYCAGQSPRCQCCGEHQFDLLTLDHPQGKGQEHRSGSSSHQFCLRLRKAGYPNDPPLLVLCFNCNMSFGFYGYCPHGNLPPRKSGPNPHE